MPQRPFGDMLRLRRQQADLTIEGLAERSGVSGRAISDIERGISVGPQRRTVIALADALDLEGDDRSDFLGAARPGRRRAATRTGAVSIRPFRLADFGGRDAEMSALATLLATEDVDAAPPILVTGAAGVGKTTVALEAFHRSADTADILFVNLLGFAATPLTPLEVLQSLLRQTKSREEPASLDDAVAAWRRAASGANLAVLLDNATSEEQVRAVLTASDRLRVIVTSRRSLAGVEGSRRVALGALERAESIEFLRRMIPEAQQQQGDLNELAALCSDLPLALRIAANRLASRPSWVVEDYVTRLRAETTRLRQLTAGDLTIESAFAPSYDALEPRSQRVFRSLSLVRGPSFRVDMVAAIDGLELVATREILDELSDLALLEPLSGDRYRLHDLLRIFAEHRLATAQTVTETDAQRARLRRWTLETARAMASTAEEDDSAEHAGPTVATAREWLIAQSDSWLAALVDAADAAQGSSDSLLPVLDAAQALIEFAERWLSFPHWRTVARIAVSAAEQLGDEVAQAEQLHMMAALELALLDGDADVARTLALRARDFAVDVGAADSAAWSLVELAWAETQRGDFAAAIAAGEQALVESIAQGSVDAQVQSRYWIAAAQMQDDPDAALYQAVAMRQTLDEHETGLSLREWNVTNNAVTAITAKALLSLGRFSEAVAVADRILDDAAFFPLEPDYLARAYRHRGFAHLGLNDRDRARDDLRKALSLVQEHERPDWWAAEIEEALNDIDSR